MPQGARGRGGKAQRILKVPGKENFVPHYISAAGLGNEGCFKLTVITGPHEHP